MNKRGQSIIEYTLIAVLVLLGIVYMGPYVLRSIGAHFKLWDEGVKDSFQENLTQAPVNDVPPFNTACNCPKDTSSGCGSSAAGSQCGANQSIWNHTCNPQYCDGAPASYCKNDTSCCSALTTVGCGATPIGQTPPSTDCNYGFDVEVQQCGSNSTVTCVADPTNCPVGCLGTISSYNGTTTAAACPGSTEGLVQPLGITYVNDLIQSECSTGTGTGTSTSTSTSTGISTACTSCDPSQKCQYYCVPPYILNSTGTDCIPQCDGTAIVPNDNIPLFVPIQFANNIATIQGLDFASCVNGNCLNGGAGFTNGWGPPSSTQMNEINYVEKIESYSSSSGVTTGWTQHGGFPIDYFDGTASSGIVIEFGTDPSYDACLPAKQQVYCLGSAFMFPISLNLGPHQMTSSSTKDMVTTVCKSYGFPNGGYPGATNRFSNGPYSDVKYMIGSDGKSAPQSTGGAFTYTFNGHTWAWDYVGGTDYWLYYYCYPNNYTVPNPPDNATICPASEGNINKTYTLTTLANCGNGECEAYCNTGYTAWENYCVANECSTFLPPANSTACTNGGALPSNFAKTPWSIAATCDGQSPCQATCNGDYTKSNNTCATDTCPKTTGVVISADGTKTVTLTQMDVTAPSPTETFSCPSRYSAGTGGKPTFTCSTSGWSTLAQDEECVTNTCSSPQPPLPGWAACSNNIPPVTQGSSWKLVTSSGACSASGSCQAYCSEGWHEDDGTCEPN